MLEERERQDVETWTRSPARGTCWPKTARPAFLPEAPDANHVALRRRAANASTLMAGLELALEGTLIAGQNQPFGPILFRTEFESVKGLGRHSEGGWQSCFSIFQLHI